MWEQFCYGINKNLYGNICSHKSCRIGFGDAHGSRRGVRLNQLASRIAGEKVLNGEEGWSWFRRVGSAVRLAPARIDRARPTAGRGAASVARGNGVRARASLHVHGAPDWMPRALGEWLRPRKRRLQRRPTLILKMMTASVSENGGAFCCRRYSPSYAGYSWCWYGARARLSAATRSRSWRPTTPSRRSRRRHGRANKSSRARSWPKRKTGPANSYPVRPPPDEYW